MSADPPRLDHRAYPQAQECERALLGGLILDPSKFDGIDIKPEYFYRPDHGNLFELLRGMHDSQTPIDVVSVAEALMSSGREQLYGGVAYVSELPEQVPATAGLEHYAAVIEEKWQRRETIRLAEELRETAIHPAPDIAAARQKVQSRLDQLDARVGRCWKPIRVGVEASIQRAMTPADLGAHVAFTGLPGLDAILGGFRRQTLTILGARPAMGKSALMLQIAMNVALTGKPVGVLSLEMSGDELADRVVSARAEVLHQSIKSRTVGLYEIQRLQKLQTALEKAPLYIDDPPECDDVEARSRFRKLQGDVGPLGLAIIDYLQLVRPSRRYGSRSEEVAAISAGLKTMSRELDVPVLAISSVSREVDKRANKRPEVSDLRESGSIESDADVILFLFRGDAYEKDPAAHTHLGEVIVAKHRGGPTGTTTAVWEGDYQRFDDRTGMTRGSAAGGR